MSQRVFTFGADGLTIANAAVTLAFINPAAAPNFGLEILRVSVSQTGTATSTMQRLQFVTQVTAFPTLTAATPRAEHFADPNASIISGGTAGAAGTCGVNASAEGAGGKTVRRQYVMNLAIPWDWTATPNDTIQLPASSASGFGVYLPAAASSLTGWAVQVTYREY